jgi:Xaa-Pro aminopeptidase
MSAARIDKLRAHLDQPLLVTGAKNVAYLTGFESSNAALLVEQNAARLFADARYSEAARAVPDVEFIETGRILLADLSTRLNGVIAFEQEHLSYAGYKTLGANGLELVPSEGLVEALRATKDEAEIATIAEAATIADRVLTMLAAEDWLGHTEREIAARLQILILETGGAGPAFDVIVGSGPNGAKPHARPSDRQVQDGDFVVIDFGVVVKGYRSDVARTIVIGEPPAELGEIFETCLHAQEAALTAIRPGMTGREADAIARDVITEAGYGGNFGHGLGHGIGLDIHEPPFLSPAFDAILEVGQAVTIEPGIYLAGIGGVRIENLCIVRAHGLESLTDLAPRWSQPSDRN